MRETVVGMVRRGHSELAFNVAITYWLDALGEPSFMETLQ